MVLATRMTASGGGEELLNDLYSVIAAVFETLGAIAMVAGFVVAVVLAIRALTHDKGGAAAFKVLRVTVGSAILLGLEILVAADLLRTMTSKPSIDEALILGMIVIIRTILSMSIQIEIEGVLPWRKALLTGGGRMLSEIVRQELSDQQAVLRKDGVAVGPSAAATGSSGTGTDE